MNITEMTQDENLGFGENTFEEKITKVLEENKLSNGKLFTYKMLTDLAMFNDVMWDYDIKSIRELREILEDYFGFIVDLHEKYGAKSLSELREKLELKYK